MFEDTELNINTSERKLLYDIRELLIEQNELLKKLIIQDKNQKENKKAKKEVKKQ